MKSNKIDEEVGCGIFVLAILASMLSFGLGLIFLSVLQALGLGFIGFALGFIGGVILGKYTGEI